MSRSRAVAAFAGLLLLTVGCGTEKLFPTSPSSSPGPAAESAVVVGFPPRNEPVDFGGQLNVLYRDTLRRGSTSAFVDVEGWVVWIQEYLRYRVNGCAHADAVAKVFSQIRGGGVAPICAEAAAGQIAFPPRDQSLEFGTQLNAFYRDELRRSPVTAFVDLEGWIVWIQEYLRYRVNDCGHADAVTRVFAQINGGGVQPVCTPGTWGFITVAGGPNACGCWIGTIEVAIDFPPRATGTLICSSSVTFSVPPGSHLVRASAGNVFRTLTVTVSPGGAAAVGLSCVS